MAGSLRYLSSLLLITSLAPTLLVVVLPETALIPLLHFLISLASLHVPWTLVHEILLSLFQHLQ